MRFLLNFLSQLRKQIPVLVALLFGFLGFVMHQKIGIGFQEGWMGGAVIGFVIGIFVRKAVPDPEEKAMN